MVHGSLELLHSESQSLYWKYSSLISALTLPTAIINTFTQFIPHVGLFVGPPLILLNNRLLLRLVDIVVDLELCTGLLEVSEK